MTQSLNYYPLHIINLIEVTCGTFENRFLNTFIRFLLSDQSIMESVGSIPNPHHRHSLQGLQLFRIHHQAASNFHPQATLFHCLIHLYKSQ